MMSSVPQPRVVLTGFMCAGKTSIAVALARRLNCLAVDLDEIISQRERQGVPSLIRQEGEAQFRALETRALRLVLEERKARVIALGGGTWTLERNRALIEEHACLTVWLDAPFALCWRRIRRTPGARPLATDMEHARMLYDERRQLYELAALHVDAAAGRREREIAAEIADRLRRWQENR